MTDNCFNQTLPKTTEKKKQTQNRVTQYFSNLEKKMHKIKDYMYIYNKPPLSSSEPAVVSQLTALLHKYNKISTYQYIFVYKSIYQSSQTQS